MCGGIRSTQNKITDLPQVTDKIITSSCIEHTWLWTGFKLTTLAEIINDCTDSCKSNFHTITITTTSCNSVDRPSVLKLCSHVDQIHEIGLILNVLYAYFWATWYMTCLTWDKNPSAGREKLCFSWYDVCLNLLHLKIILLFCTRNRQNWL